MSTSSVDSFKPYLDSVKETGTRTRAMMYINIVLIAIMMTAIRNYTYPGWHDKLFFKAISIAKCFDDNNSGQIKADDKKKCDTDISIISNGSISDSNLLRSPSAQRTVFDELLKINVDERTKSQIFSIPILGISLHENDTWIVTGIFGFVSLILLREFMKRELETLKTAKPLIPDQTYRDAIISSQIFAVPDLTASQKLFRQLMFLLLYFVPFILHSISISSDIFSLPQINIITDYLGTFGGVIEYVLEVGTWIGLLLLGWSCNSIGMSIENTIQEIKAG